MGIPVYIIACNQLTYVRNMVQQLLRFVEPSDIIVVDNCRCVAFVVFT